MATEVPLPWYVPKESAQLNQDRLTFGVELEFALAANLPTGEDPDPEDPRVITHIDDVDPTQDQWVNARLHVARTLNDAGIQAEALPALNGPDWEWQPNDIRSWVVKPDGDIGQDLPDEWYMYHSIEINTPPMYFSPEAVYALHVHVRNEAKGFDLETLKKLTVTYWTVEPQLELIHPKFRIDNINCPSMQRGSNLMNGVTLGASERNLRGALDYILGPRCSNLNRLWDATMAVDQSTDSTGERRGALNIGPLAGAEEGDHKKTIEFRQHTMTMDPIEVAHWIRVCVGLLEFSDTVKVEILRPFLNDNADKITKYFNLEEALTMLGMPREGKYFSKAKNDKHDRRN